MTIGEYLKQKREEKKITLEQVSDGTNIRINFLRAIEEDRLDVLPSMSQAKGFCRLYAAYLGLDSRVVFDEVEKANQPVKPTEEQTAIQEKVSVPIEVEKHEPITTKRIAEAIKWRRKEPEKEIPQTESTVKPQYQIIFEEIGKELKQQRDALGLSRADVERQIKIREYFIYSLEHGQIDNLPSTVQGRGMLNNYAAFMNLDAESLQLRYAEGLQARREEQHRDEEDSRKTGINVVGKEPLSGWRRFLTPDLLIGGSVFIVLFGLVIWGAIQVIRTSIPAAEPTLSSISDVLTGDATPSPEWTQEATGSGLITGSSTTESQSTAIVGIQSTMTFTNAGPIQIVVVAYQRAFMRIVVDGKEEFLGRVVPGNVYSYSGKTKITLLTGNGAALQVYYNQQDQGVLGLQGKVVELEFTPREMVTPTPRFTATPTLTQQPTLTAQPTQTPQPSATVPTATITPVRTIVQ